jgi:hypothetical protein
VFAADHDGFGNHPILVGLGIAAGRGLAPVPACNQRGIGRLHIPVRRKLRGGKFRLGKLRLDRFAAQTLRIILFCRFGRTAPAYYCHEKTPFLRIAFPAARK